MPNFCWYSIWCCKSVYCVLWEQLTADLSHIIVIIIFVDLKRFTYSNGSLQKIHSEVSIPNRLSFRRHQIGKPGVYNGDCYYDLSIACVCVCACVRMCVCVHIAKTNCVSLLTDKLEQSFQLYAICNHLGDSPFSGHYVADCKWGNVWYRFNDETYDYILCGKVCSWLFF